jgi:hypothetical protein
MLLKEAQKVLIEQGIQVFKEMRDVDGPGVGNTAIVERDERPEEGGILVYLYGYKYPYKGIPDQDSVIRFRVVKKIFLFVLHSFYNKGAMAIIGFLFLLPKFITKGIVWSVINFFYSLTEWLMIHYLLKPNRYCTCVRELYRTFTVLIDKEKDDATKKALTMSRDVFCLFIEQDSAYKFRFQDIMAEVREERIRKGGMEMVNEIRRLMTILKVRELFPVFAEHKWGTIEKFLYPALMTGFFRKLIHEFVKEVDFNKLKPDAGDWYFDTMRLDYEFGGKTLDQRLAERKEVDRENWDKYNYEEEAQAFLAEYRKYLGTRDYRLDIRDFKKQKEAVKKREQMIKYINQ